MVAQTSPADRCGKGSAPGHANGTLDRAAPFVAGTRWHALCRAHDHIVPQTDQRSVPPGWSYNPSDWSQRIPIAALALMLFALWWWAIRPRLARRTAAAPAQWPVPAPAPDSGTDPDPDQD